VRLFYDFSCAGYPFFVLDGRTQRFKDDVGGELQNNHLLGRPSQHPTQPSQLDRFCAWLRHMQEDRGNTPKFVVSASVFVPNAVTTTEGDKHKQEDDSWPAFPETRRAVLDCIVKNKVQNVVFLSGDIHCANLARMTFTGTGKDLIAYSITSSAFYWPFPFADGEPADYVHDSRSARDGFKLSGNLGVMHYKAWAFTQADNFCRVDVDPNNHALSVRVFGTEGDPLATSKQNNKVNTNAETLRLAPW
jgi:alkaline phosphatase D